MTLDLPYRRTPRRKIAVTPPSDVTAKPVTALTVTPSPLTLRRDVYYCYDPANKQPSSAYLCIVCCRPISAPLVTCEVAKKGTDKLYSYQAHQKCWAGISDREKRVFDQSLRDLLAKGAT
jgi:hypothetical protein